MIKYIIKFINFSFYSNFEFGIVHNIDCLNFGVKTQVKNSNLKLRVCCFYVNKFVIVVLYTYT